MENILGITLGITIEIHIIKNMYKRYVISSIGFPCTILLVIYNYYRVKIFNLSLTFFNLLILALHTEFEVYLKVLLERTILEFR